MQAIAESVKPCRPYPLSDNQPTAPRADGGKQIIDIVGVKTSSSELPGTFWCVVAAKRRLQWIYPNHTRLVLCPERVKSGRDALSLRCPLLPRKQTFRWDTCARKPNDPMEWFCVPLFSKTLTLLVWRGPLGSAKIFYHAEIIYFF